MSKITNSKRANQSDRAIHVELNFCTAFKSSYEQ